MRLSLAAAFLFGLATAGAAPVISEIMFHPPHTDGREDPLQEWLEIHNPGLREIDLTGWQITAGVSFTFPNLSIPPGGYLVVAADLAAFQALHPAVTNVVGGWTGRLSNQGETIRLADHSGIEADRVDYADSGDWAVRRPGPDDRGHTGWVWQSPADGGGKSMELRNAALPNRGGQNWLPSTPDLGTPGKQNSAFSLNVPPLIQDVSHHPPVPRPTDLVLVRARLTDDLTTPRAVVRYRISSLDPGPFRTLAMRNDGFGGDEVAGDDIHSAVLPAQPDGTVVEFYLEAFDATQSRTWPGPTDQLGTQGANLLFQVDSEDHQGREPLYRLILSVPENEELTEIPSNGEQRTNAQFNTTFIAQVGPELTTVYRGGTRLRGASSRSRFPPSLKIRLPGGTNWQGQNEFNLNSQFSYNQLLGSLFYRMAGLAAYESKAVQVRMNGFNHAASQNAPNNTFTRHYGFYVHNEPINSRFADNHFPLDPNGNLYRKSGSNTAWEYFPDSLDLAADYSRVGWEKENNTAANDWTDLHNFIGVLTTASEPQYLQQVEAVIDLESWLRTLAVSTILTNSENSLFTGRSDDFALYRGGDGKFRLLPHDLDTLLGQGDSSRIEITDLPHTIFDFVSRGDSLAQLEPLFQQPSVVRRYYRILAELLAGPFEESRANALIDDALAWTPPYRTATAKRFLAARRADILSKIQPALSASSSLDVVDDYFHTTGSEANLSGRFNAAGADSVLVNGSPASLDFRNASWSFTATGLNPGLNRLLVEERDMSGTLLSTAFLDVHYDDGDTRSIAGTLSANTRLDAARGPWSVPSTLVVPSGRTLTIEPGTSLYFHPGAGLEIQAGGTLACRGTESNRVRLTRPPGTDGSWEGLRFTTPPGQRSTTENIISRTDMEFGDDQGEAILLRRSRLTLDHVTWEHSAATVLELTSPQLEVRDCAFPAVPSSAVINGTTLTGDDYLILHGNLFLPSAGYHDIIRFAGGRRPGPILAAYYNVFTGSSDDCIDLDSADAHLEGNIFMKVHLDQPRESTSNAIAANNDSHLTIVRNLFYDLDHALLLKNNAASTFEHNTVVQATVAALNFDEPLQAGSVPGERIDMDSNLFVDCASIFANAVSVPPEPDPVIIGHRNFLPAAHLGIGVENFNLDPFLADQEAGPWPKSNWALLTGSPAIGSGRNGADRGALVPRGANLSGVPGPVTDLTSATLIIRGPGITHYRWRLVSDGAPGAWSNDLPVSSPITLATLSEGTYRVDLLARDSAGYWQEPDQLNSSPTWRVVDTAPGAIVLSEISARPSPEVDVVELYNGTDTPVDLTGWFLTDDPEKPRKAPLSGTILPGTYRVFSGASVPGLDSHGEALYLYQGATFIDSVSWGPQVPGFTIGRVAPEGNWSLTTPTIGAANQRAGTAPARNLRINEWLASFQVRYRNEFVEIYNPGDSPAPLAGLWLSDSPDHPLRHQIPPLSFVGANGFVTFRPAAGPAPAPGEIPFTLDASYEWIVLSDPSGLTIDQVPIVCLQTDLAEGRNPDGSDHIQTFPLGSPGHSNNRNRDQRVATTLLPFQSRSWAYLDNASPPPDWNRRGFDEAGWKTGPAPLGRETSALPVPLATDPDSDPPFNYTANRKNYYFRRTFEFTGNPAATSLHLSTYLDDGAIFYLNGRELFRHNMPRGIVDGSTWANVTVGNAGFEGPFQVPSHDLVSGTNLLAVVTYQAGPTSSDIVFDCELTAVETIPAQPDPAHDALLDLLDHLRITEVMYNPAAGSVGEFIELQNISSTIPLDLSGVRVMEGVQFLFPALTLAPGERIVIVRDISFFREVYENPDIRIAGEFDSKLDNGGETIALTLPEPWNMDIQSFTYDDGWHSLSDTDRSLELIDPNRPLASWNEAASWIASHHVHGSPGAPNSAGSFRAWTAALGTGAGDTDQDSLPDHLEYALGLDPLVPDFLSVLHSLDFSPATGLASTFLVPAIAPPDTIFLLQSSTNLRNWVIRGARIGNGQWFGTNPVESVLPPSGLGLATLRLPDASPQAFTRMVVVITR